MPEDPDQFPIRPKEGGSQDASTGFAGETTNSIGRTASASEETFISNPSIKSETIGDFEILSKLGQGGMGAVYRARQISLDRLVALKVLPAALEADAEFVTRFQREARIAASLNHANLVRVFSSGLADGCHYFAMELVEGENLGQWLKRGPLPPVEALRICLCVARALECGWQSAHLIHRDIKPGNIFLSETGEVKVGDLGLAKSLDGETTGLTHTGTAMGTPHYISPEQANGDKDIDFRADIYSLGCTLYQMLTGRTPYEGGTPVQVMHQHIHSAPPAILKVLPQCPIPLVRLVGKMLRKNKRERHATYGELIAQVEAVLTHFTGPGSPLESTLPPDPEATLLSTPARTPPSATPVTQPVGRLQPLPAKKSNAVLYGGIAAGVLVVGAIVAFLPRPKEAKLSQVERMMIEREKARKAAPESAPAVAPAAVPAPTSPAASATEKPEAWKDMLREPGALQLLGSVERTDAGLLFASSGTAMTDDPQTQRRDGAVRMRAVHGGARPSLRARWSKTMGTYFLFAKYDQIVLLQRYDETTGKTLGVGSFKLPAPLSPGQIYELELRAEGRTLTAKFNGAVLGTAEDDHIAEGQFGVAVTDTGGPPTTVQAIEILDLETPK